MASVLKLNRNAATLLAVYDPVGTGVNAAQNVDSWNCQGRVGNNLRIFAQKVVIFNRNKLLLCVDSDNGSNTINLAYLNG